MPNNNVYTGWVPSVSGNLFLEYCRCSEENIPNDCVPININEVKDNKRYIILSTQKDLQDKKIFEDKKFKKNGIFKIILQANSGNKDSILNGKVHIVHQKYFNLFDQDKSINQSIQKANAVKNSKEKSIVPLYNEIKLKLEQDTNVWTINFSLDKCGFVDLSLHKTSNLKQDMFITIIRQAFYFIKYSIHQHQHHHHNDDNIVKAHEGDLYETYFHIINDLKSSLIFKKREDDEDVEFGRHYSLNTTRGIVAYAKSLMESLLSRGVIDEKVHSQQINYFNNIAESLHNRYNNSEIEKEKIKSRNDFTRVLIMFFFTLTAPLLLIYSKSHNASDVSPHIFAEYLIGLYTNVYAWSLFVILIIVVYTGQFTRIVNLSVFKIMSEKFQVFLDVLKDSKYIGMLLKILLILLMVSLLLTIKFLIY